MKKIKNPPIINELSSDNDINQDNELESTVLQKPKSRKWFSKKQPIIEESLPLNHEINQDNELEAALPQSKPRKWFSKKTPIINESSTIEAQINQDNELETALSKPKSRKWFSKKQPIIDEFSSSITNDKLIKQKNLLYNVNDSQNLDLIEKQNIILFSDYKKLIKINNLLTRKYSSKIIKYNKRIAKYSKLQNNIIDHSLPLVNQFEPVNEVDSTFLSQPKLRKWFSKKQPTIEESLSSNHEINQDNELEVVLSQPKLRKWFSKKQPTIEESLPLNHEINQDNELEAVLPKPSSRKWFSKKTPIINESSTIEDQINSDNELEAALPQPKSSKQFSKTPPKPISYSTSGDLLPDVNNIIELHNVDKYFLTGVTPRRILSDINLKIRQSEFVVILGSSGSGKTTLLNIISGLDKAQQGDVFVNNYNLSFLKDAHLTLFRRKNISFVFQQYNLLNNLSAMENIQLGAYLNPDKSTNVDDIIEMVGLTEHKYKFPHQLSGGQQQRVAIARALAKKPIILFCDEPTGALDDNTSRIMLNILVNINKKLKTTIVMVTHNTNITSLADTVVFVKNGKIDKITTNHVKMDVADLILS